MAVDWFLKIDGVEGESTVGKHEKELDIKGWSWEASQPSSTEGGGGVGAGKVSVHGMRFNTFVSQASPTLHLACCTGKPFKTAVVTCRKAGGNEQINYLIYTLYEVIVEHYKLEGVEAASTLPVETFRLGFSKFECEYVTQDAQGAPAGSVKVCYDLKKMETC